MQEDVYIWSQKYCERQIFQILWVRTVRQVLDSMDLQFMNFGTWAMTLLQSFFACSFVGFFILFFPIIHSFIDWLIEKFVTINGPFELVFSEIF